MRPRATERATRAHHAKENSGGGGLPGIAAASTGTNGSARALCRPHPGVVWWVPPRQPMLVVPFVERNRGRHRATTVRAGRFALAATALPAIATTDRPLDSWTGWESIAARVTGWFHRSARSQAGAMLLARTP